MKIRSAALVLSLSLVVFGMSAPSLSRAADSAPGISDASTATAPTKQQKKVARKQARAKKNAELKKLEEAGYNPARKNDPNYPQDLQDAQRKAGVGGAASQ